MPLPLPSSLSPSKVSAFRDCALAFRFAVIDKLPEPVSPAAVKGTLVHRALERLFWNHERGARTADIAVAELAAAWDDLMAGDELPALELNAADTTAFRADAQVLVRNYLSMEDPNGVDAIGVELMVEADLPEFRLRGIIDRLDRTPEGELVVVDYKTGRSPSAMHEQARLAGVHIYAMLCEEMLGRRPVTVRLLYLRDRLAIDATPSEQSVRGMRIKTSAVWTAIERACVAEDFRPHPSRLCDYCGFRAYCPAVGGDPSLVPDRMPVAV